MQFDHVGGNALLPEPALGHPGILAGHPADGTAVARLSDEAEPAGAKAQVHRLEEVAPRLGQNVLAYHPEVGDAEIDVGGDVGVA